MPRDSFSRTELQVFEQHFDTSFEDKAVNSRGEFLRAYPLNRLQELRVDDYVIGKGTASFCAFVEPKTKAWADIRGSTAFKFGIYFGITKSDSKRQYRFTAKFGENDAEAFKAVKAALLGLVESGASRDFSGIDKNLLSQMFKAKVLSLYFPDDYLNVCSSEHLKLLASKLGISKQPPFLSEYQHLLIKKKLENAITKNWSNPKFMYFLYRKYIRENLEFVTTTTFKKPKTKSRRRVDFEDIAESRDAVGRKSEEFALAWEKNRLIGLEYQELVSQIVDRREIPSYGYDFLSHSSPGCERFIEVKSAGKDRIEGGYRLYLSENQYCISKSNEHGHEYYFYLVFYDNNGNPCDLLAKRATELYSSSVLSPCAYIMRFDLEAKDER